MVYPVILFITLVLFLSSNAMFMLQTVPYFGFILDEASLFIVFMTVFVIFVSYLVALSFSQLFRVSLTLMFMYFFCFIVFRVDNILLLYICYEASLLPILYIIVK